jgi:hypothetical protein
MGAQMYHAGENSLSKFPRLPASQWFLMMFVLASPYPRKSLVNYGSDDSDTCSNDCLTDEATAEIQLEISTTTVRRATSVSGPVVFGVRPTVLVAHLISRVENRLNDEQEIREW